MDAESPHSCEPRAPSLVLYVGHEGDLKVADRVGQAGEVLERSLEPGSQRLDDRIAANELEVVVAHSPQRGEVGTKRHPGLATDGLADLVRTVGVEPRSDAQDPIERLSRCPLPLVELCPLERLPAEIRCEKSEIPEVVGSCHRPVEQERHGSNELSGDTQRHGERGLGCREESCAIRVVLDEGRAIDGKLQGSLGRGSRDGRIRPERHARPRGVRLRGDSDRVDDDELVVLDESDRPACGAEHTRRARDQGMDYFGGSDRRGHSRCQLAQRLQAANGLFCDVDVLRRTVAPVA